MKNRVREYRYDFQMTQEELGKIVGLTRQKISALESGRYDPPLKVAYKLVIVFKCSSIEELFPLTEDFDFKYDHKK